MGNTKLGTLLKNEAGQWTIGDKVIDKNQEFCVYVYPTWEDANEVKLGYKTMKPEIVFLTLNKAVDIIMDDNDIAKISVCMEWRNDRPIKTRYGYMARIIVSETVVYSW